MRLLKAIFRRFRTMSHNLRDTIFGIPDYGWADFRYDRLLLKESPSEQELEEMCREAGEWKYRPKISVVVPVYNISQEILIQAIESVIAQLYDNWELCLSDDASPKKHVKNILKKYDAVDKRIKVKYLKKNRGISGASNEALSLATGEYVALLDHDDELSYDSLYEVVKFLNQHRDADIIYSDEDKLTMGGRRLRPVLKGDWDPDLFLTYNYFCHLVVARRGLIEKAGGFREGFEGSQDYDLLLRITEQTEKIYHIPKILYHWRMIPGSAAMVVDAKKEAFDRSKKALEDAMKRRNINAVITDGPLPGTFKVIKQ